MAFTRLNLPLKLIDLRLAIECCAGVVKMGQKGATPPQGARGEGEEKRGGGLSQMAADSRYPIKLRNGTHKLYLKIRPVLIFFRRILSGVHSVQGRRVMIIMTPPPPPTLHPATPGTPDATLAAS